MAGDREPSAAASDLSGRTTAVGPDVETTALKVSSAGTLFMAALGIGFALWARSDAIMLDGFFSLVGFAFSLVTLRVAALVRKGDDEKFHFGYAYFEPFLNMVRGVVMLGLCGFALAGAVDALLHGGRPLETGPALVYSVIAVAGSFSLALFVRRAAAGTGSLLLQVDATSWMIDGAVSVVVAIAFGAAFLLDGTTWAAAIPYVDPGLVIVLVVFLAGVPAGLVGRSALELLQAAPDPESQRMVYDAVDSSLEGLSIKDRYVRMLTAGRFAYVMVGLVVGDAFSVTDVRDLDRIRQRISDSLKGIHDKLYVDVVFTQDPKWVDA